MHSNIVAIEQAERIICRTHGVSRAQCREIHRLASIGVTGTVGASVGALLGGAKGAAWGGLIGGLLGVTYPNFAEWVRQEADTGNLAFLP